LIGLPVEEHAMSPIALSVTFGPIALAATGCLAIVHAPWPVRRGGPAVARRQAEFVASRPQPLSRSDPPERQ
jgi:hypothetical protein